MKKKKLLSIKKLEVTKKMIEMVKNDVGTKKETHYGYYKREKDIYFIYETYQYYRAVVEEGIIKIAVFERKQIADGLKMPRFEIYVDKKENTWITYEPYEKKWYTAKIDMLRYRMERGLQHGNKPYATQETYKIVNNYFGTEKKQVKDAILNFQQSIQKNKLVKKHKSELEEIDSVMNVVPPAPKDFDEWILKEAFIDRRYIFYKAEKKTVKEGYCTHCKKIVPIKIKPYHNVGGKCTVCHSEITYKAWNKQKTIVDKKNVGIMQKLTDESGYILRKYLCKLKYTKENDWRLSYGGAWEQDRLKLNNNLMKVEFFEWGEYKYTGVQRWCHDINKGGYYGYRNYGFGSAVFYPRNMKKNLQNTKLKYIPVKAILDAGRGKNSDLAELLLELVENPQYEYLVKAGLTKFVFEMSASGNRKESILTDRSKSKPWEYIKMDKEQFKECCKINANKDEVRVVQISNEAKVKMTRQQVQWIAKYAGRSHIIDDMTHTTPHKMIRYLREVLDAEKRKERIGDYADYLSDCNKLELEFTEQTMYPQDFDKAHEEIALQVAEKENKDKAMQKKIQDILYQKSMNDKEKLYEFSDKNFTIILPKSKDEFQNEGREQHNCVGGYFENVLKGTCVVLFLRKKEEQEKSFCTVEIKGTKLIQCRAAYNQDAPEDAQRFIHKFLNVLEKRIQKDMKEKKIEIQQRVAV